jgi:hypothetical protein
MSVNNDEMQLSPFEAIADRSNAVTKIASFDGLCQVWANYNLRAGSGPSELFNQSVELS